MSLSTADRLEILQVIARADLAATRRDAADYVGLFTDDAVLDGDMGEHRGKELLRQSVGPIWASEGPASVHLTLNAVVDPVDGRADRAIATSILLILSGEPPIAIHSVSSIIQYFVKIESDWQIERRSVRPVAGKAMA